MQTANAKTLLVTKLDTKLGGSGAGGGGEGVGRAIGGVQKLQVPVLGSQRCLICAFNNHGTWSMSGARLRLLTQDFSRSFTGEEGGGGAAAKLAQCKNCKYQSEPEKGGTL